MNRTWMAIGMISTTVFLSADLCQAQIGFGVTRQNGIVTGGSLQLGGYVNSGRTGMRMGVSASSSELIGIDTFSVPGPIPQFGANASNGAGNRGIAGNRRRREPTVGQFVKATRRFDRDKNKLLDEEELASIGAALLAEVRKRQASTASRSASRSSATKVTTAVSKEEQQQQVDTFVKQCLRFDKDKDQALNSRETKKMAAAFLRSMG